MRLVRWVPRASADEAIANSFKAHKTNIAFWVFDLDQSYRPGARVAKDAVLLKYEFPPNKVQMVREHLDRNTIDFEDESFKGESKHPRENIVKQNEPGAYGLGTWRAACTDHHVKEVVYASRGDVADALEASETEVAVEKHRPKSGWPPRTRR